MLFAHQVHNSSSSESDSSSSDSESSSDSSDSDDSDSKSPKKRKKESGSDSDDSTAKLVETNRKLTSENKLLGTDNENLRRQLSDLQREYNLVNTLRDTYKSKLEKSEKEKEKLSARVISLQQGKTSLQKPGDGRFTLGVLLTVNLHFQVTSLSFYYFGAFPVCF